MKKVFLVDDEILIRETIRDCIRWEDEGFHYSGDAPDGELALPLLEEHMPDILITDIKMPFMDGLELAAVVRERFPSMKIIFLSGHGEFEYARKALRMGVEEYCLKPVSAQDLVGLLHAVGDKIDREKAEALRIRRLQDGERDQSVRSREKLLNDLCSGFLSPADAMHGSTALDLDLLGRYYMAVLADCRCKDAGEAEAALAGEAAERLRALALRAGAVECRRSRTETVWLLKSDSREALLREQEAFRRFQQECEDRTAAYAVGVGSIRERLMGVHVSFLEAQEDLHGRRLVKRLGLRASEEAAARPGLGTGAEPVGKYDGIITKVKAFIREHYDKEQISLQDAADHVNLSPSHLSKVFSRETGQTFIEHLTQVRMEKAMELLRTTADKSYEIAFRVGYNDPHYFSNLFKRATGMTTKEFRSRPPAAPWDRLDTGGEVSRLEG